MSLKSWKAEFYTIDAKNVSEENAVAHSLQKWIGLRPENLNKHEVSFLANNVIGDDSNILDIDGESCALCVHHVHHVVAQNHCKECPLLVYLGKTCDGEPDSPYGYWLDTADPEPMISALSALCEQRVDCI